MKFYRIEHKNIIAKETNWYLGSWYACWTKASYFDNNFKNKLSYFYEEIEDPIIKRFSRTCGSKMPVSWRSLTVGPARDPHLREWYLSTYVNNPSKYVFGTCSIEQMKPWINEKTINLLHDNGFVLRIYKSRHTIEGLRQSVMATDKPYQKLKEFSIKKVFG